ncbi:MAG TPA: RHS repeat-associated core domain-containing protein [Puia sp.]|nr:RHS repeat-associated core domain-containing protein [Puia sp.]
MGATIRCLSNPLLYNYQYDQLNRLVHMDAWNRTGTAWSAITKVPDFQESIAYDPNGNIQGYKRNGNNTFAGKPIGMDSLNYAYTPGTNKLDHITDSVPSGNYTTDIDGQSSGNYQYDSIGELVSDAASGITNITWTVYGKIASITKSGDTTLLFTYDPSGNRISKSVVHAGQTETTWYVRDAQGNVMSVYKAGDPAVHGMHLTQTELHIYGSSRLGILKTNNDVEMKALSIRDSVPLLGSGDSLIFTRGNKLFELTNHLGNVLATISDKRNGVSTNDSTVNYFTPDVVSANDYYPFGSQQPGRSYTESGAGSYRYGFNGKENDNEVKGDGDQIDYGFRVYDPRVGRFLSVDPLGTQYPWNSSYAYAENDVIRSTDLDGLEKYLITTTNSTDKNGSAVQSRHLTINPHTEQWGKGLIGHYDANNKLTMINDPSQLSTFDQTVYKYMLSSMKVGIYSGVSIKMNGNTDINLQEPAPFKDDEPTVGYRNGINTTTTTTVTMNMNLTRSLDANFNIQEADGPKIGEFYKNPAEANRSIGDYASFLIKNGITSIDLGISTVYTDPNKNDYSYRTAQGLLEARVATVRKSFSKFGVSINKVDYRYGEAEPSVWGTSSTQIKRVTGWNVSQIPVQQKLLNGMPTGPVTVTGKASTPKFIPNLGQPAPKSKVTWK